MGPQNRKPRVIILFSGAVRPGTNALLGTLVRLGLKRHEVDLLGARNGFAGLVSLAERFGSGRITKSSLLGEIAAHQGVAGFWRTDLDLVRLDHSSVAGLHERGGIVLGTSRCPEFYAAAVRRGVINLLENLDVDAMIVCGGDGSLTAARRLASESSLRIVGIPATIDNELPMTETALGVDSALNTLTRLAGEFGNAFGGHPSIMVLEVMCRTSGELAHLAGLALGATIVVTPEQGALTKDDIVDMARRLERAILGGQRQPIVLVAEGVGLDAALVASGDSHPTVRLAQELAAHFRRHASLVSNLDVRASIPGHLLRASAPSAADRVLAARFAESAWKAITSPREPSGILGLRHGLIMLHDFDARTDAEQIETAETLDSLQQDVITV